MPANLENGPSDATTAMLMRQSKVSSEAPGGATAISVVEPPPFFHGVGLAVAGANDAHGGVRPRPGRSSLFCRAQSIAMS